MITSTHGSAVPTDINNRNPAVRWEAHLNMGVSGELTKDGLPSDDLCFVGLVCTKAAEERGETPAHCTAASTADVCRCRDGVLGRLLHRWHLGCASDSCTDGGLDMTFAACSRAPLRNEWAGVSLMSVPRDVVCCQPRDRSPCRGPMLSTYAEKASAADANITLCGRGHVSASVFPPAILLARLPTRLLPIVPPEPQWTLQLPADDPA